MSKIFEKQLCHLLPDASVRLLSSTPWFSVTFSGAQLWYELQIARAVDEQKLATLLADGEFAIPGQYVADIAVIEHDRGDNGDRIIILALLLDA